MNTDSASLLDQTHRETATIYQLTLINHSALTTTTTTTMFITVLWLTKGHSSLGPELELVDRDPFLLRTLSAALVHGAQPALPPHLLVSLPPNLLLPRLSSSAPTFQTQKHTFLVAAVKKL